MKFLFVAHSPSPILIPLGPNIRLRILFSNKNRITYIKRILNIINKGLSCIRSETKLRVKIRMAERQRVKKLNKKHVTLCAMRAGSDPHDLYCYTTPITTLLYNYSPIPCPLICPP